MFNIVSKADVIFEMFEKDLPSYYKTKDIRLSQVQMAFDIAYFLENTRQRIMFVEAPVGTGKSLGALVPTLIDVKLHSDSFKKIIYATSTINLQGQLADEELPTLKELKLLNNFIVAKGKSHYLCYRNVLHDKHLFNKKVLDNITNFFNDSDTGQRSDLEGKYGMDIEDSIWKKVEFTGTPSNCRNCDFANTCPTKQHRDKFNGGHQVTVTNHDQLISSYLRQLEDSGRAPLLPLSPGILIIDEAHHFLENFIGRLEKRFSLSGLKILSKDIKLRKDEAVTWREAYKQIELWVNETCQTAEGAGRYIIPEIVKNYFVKLHKIIDGYTLRAKGYLAERLEDWGSQLSRFFTDSGYVSWFSNDDKQFVSIPDSFRAQFKQLLQMMTTRNKVIFMSGTLTVAGDFSTLIKQWGLLEADVFTRSYESPFDYTNQALIYVPDGLVQPNHKEYKEHALNAIKNLLQLTEGRTLLLNTSKDHMKTFYNGIKPLLEDMDIPLYLQGDRGVEKITSMFKQLEQSVLVGSGSFFSGFSVSGTALTSVILNRLPFPVPDDPVFELMGAGLTNQQFFNQITYPTMVNKLNQASGRLIRSISDYGIFTILDSRVYTNSEYSGDIQYLLSLQGYKLTRSWEEVVTFYNRKLANGDEGQYKMYKHEDIKVHPNLYQEQIVPQKDIILEGQRGTKRAKKKRIKKNQKDFLIDFCQQSGIDTSKIMSSIKGDPEQAYIAVYKWAKANWMNVATLRDKFPYRDEDERKKLECFDGGERRYLMPPCTKFQCTGRCSAENRQKVQNYFKDNYEVDIEFIERNKRCCLVNGDKSIMLQDEFHPGLDRLNGSVI
ncbi:ATP-dependent DNA helicase [Bacillus subtilis]|uniref:ATP-dependent DNA helicase n=1 Tax=Bacillus subtilis TaxID=1423 RepID=UPI0014318D66|nr:ATP-dependent DNA helicase [Bacillus subtilis]MCP6731222.1 ATP-dependent DNA helicase [Bacillus subtilis]MED1776528.1 ATP-dependent DNA helicase [Bacillus subtilis]NJF04273.1 ATP-dependent DNA helicase [Bacillus subtilis]